MWKSLAEFCAQQEAVALYQDDLWLPESSAAFLDRLNLPTRHPFCTNTNSGEDTFDNDLATTNILNATAAKLLGPPTINKTLTNIHRGRLGFVWSWDPMGLYPQQQPKDGFFSDWLSCLYLWEQLVTFYYINVYPAIGFWGLWCRLWAGYLAPVAVAILWGQLMLRSILLIIKSLNITSLERHDEECNETREMRKRKFPGRTILRRALSFHSKTLNIVAILSCWIVMVDSMYVYEYGGTHWPGFKLLFIATLLVCNSNSNSNDGCSGRNVCSEETRIQNIPTRLGERTMILFILTSFLLFSPTKVIERWFSSVTLRPGRNWVWDPDTTVQIPREGLYYAQRTKNNNVINSNSNPLVHRIVDHWPREHWTYRNPTPWMINGDIRTGLPFLLNSVPNPSWYRVYLTVDAPTVSSTIEMEDGGVNGESDANTRSKEVVALDICFPPQGHDSDHPVYLILHGANGGSQEHYVKDFAYQHCTLGSSTVAVLVARGLMDLPLQTHHYYHSGRMSDLHAAAKQLRRAIDPQQILAGVGYSVGSIVLSHYVVASGPDKCALDAAFCISGSLECRYQQNFTRSQQLWQPMISHHVRSDQHMSKWGEVFRQSTPTRKALVDFLRASNMGELDQATHRPTSLTEFYANMSALGDVPLDKLLNPSSLMKSSSPNGGEDFRIHNLSIPLCVLHALDDPISTWRNNIAEDPNSIMHPLNLVETGRGYLMLLLTRKGGHVGWPQGWFPWRRRWSFMNTAAATFVEAVAKAKKELEEEFVGIVKSRE